MASMACAVDARVLDGAPRGGGQRGHVVGVALRGVVRIFLLAEQRVLGGRRRPDGPLTESKMETRTLSVPKSTPATMLMKLLERSVRCAC